MVSPDLPTFRPPGVPPPFALTICIESSRRVGCGVQAQSPLPRIIQTPFCLSSIPQVEQAEREAAERERKLKAKQGKKDKARGEKEKAGAERAAREAAEAERLVIEGRARCVAEEEERRQRLEQVRHHLSSGGEGRRKEHGHSAHRKLAERARWLLMTFPFPCPFLRPSSEAIFCC